MVAGLLAFICYAVVVPILIPDDPRVDPEMAEVTAFTVAFQAAGYLVAMAVANVCYSLAPLSERMVQPADVERYRCRCYRLGYWFSVLLPFGIPVLLAVRVLFDWGVLRY